LTLPVWWKRCSQLIAVLNRVLAIFMDRIGKGAVSGRVCIVLSDKYLKSPYCMHELFDVWRNCREDGGTFIDRTRVFVLPGAKIATAVERAQYVIHWQSQFKAADALVREHGQFVLSVRQRDGQCLAVGARHSAPALV
jgi:internalin A